MSTKKKEGKRKKQNSPDRATAHCAPTEVNGEAEIEASFPEMYENVCRKMNARFIPKIVNADPVGEDDDDGKKVTKKRGKKAQRSTVSRSESSPAHAASSGAASTGGSTGVMVPAGTTDDTTFTTAEVLNVEEEAGAGAETPRPITVRPPSIRVTYYDAKKATIPQALSYEAVPIRDVLLIALEKCLPIYPTITSLTFKKCDLPGDMVVKLADILRCAENVKELTIDDCPHLQQNFYSLVREGRYLELLILRGCKINDEGARMIAVELAYKEDYKDHTTLFYLNLSVNMIGDRGARHLAKALRTNRTLLALTLTANLITDFGAIVLANVLKDFELNEDEVLDRRQYIYHRFKAYLEMREELVEEVKAAKALEAVDQKQNQEAPAEAPKGGKKKKEKQKASKQKDSLGVEAHLDLWKQTSGCEFPGYDHPFVSDVFKSERKLWSRGNLRLSHLNLSYNSITSLGVEKFLQAVSYQARVKRVSPKLAQSGYTGLTNLILQGNLFSLDCPEMIQIVAYITNSSELDIRRSDQSFLGEATQTPDKPSRMKYQKGPLPLYTSFHSTAEASTQCAF